MKKIFKIKTNRITKKLLSKKGETIIETLVSLLIMGLLITSLLSIIRFAMVLTSDSLIKAAISQNRFNDLIHDTNNPYQSTPVDLVFVVGTPAGDFTAIQPVHLSAAPINPDAPIVPGAFKPGG